LSARHTKRPLTLSAMFHSYLSGREKHLYAPLSLQSDTGRVGSSLKPTQSSWRRSFFQALVVLELVHVMLFAAFYGLSHFSKSHETHAIRHHLDSYFELFKYDTIKSFHGNSATVNNSAESDAFFEKIQRSDGVVALDTQWALEQGYAPSRVQPDDSTKSIYLIDMFHSLHCVYRIRNKLTSSMSLEQWPRNDEHTLHCLDYIREQLMCHPDLMLDATEDMIHFDINPGHQCRSSDNITDWAIAHHWEGHRQFLIDTVGYQ